MNVINNLARFKGAHIPAPFSVKPLGSDHPAVIEGRSIFTSTVVNAEHAPRLLVSAVNNRKIGKQVQKGEWAGMPIYTLTLEERATCPSHCSNWDHCYGNAMHMARRHRHGPELEQRLQIEVAMLAREHLQGFVVRLHVLGDFYSVDYAQVWLDLLYRHSELHIYGYTARTAEADGPIAAVIGRMYVRFPDRCFIRTSTRNPIAGGASVVMDATPMVGAIVCPAETSKTECCATCTLCWAPAARDKAILFLLHGNPWGGRPRKAKTEIMTEESGWIELSPWRLSKTKQPRLTLKTATMGKWKSPVLYLGFNKALIETTGWDFKDPNKRLARVEVGHGLFKGMLKITPDMKGRYKLAGQKGHGRMLFRLPGKIPTTSASEILEYELRDGAMLIKLPDKWSNIVSTEEFSSRAITKAPEYSRPAAAPVVTRTIEPIAPPVRQEPAPIKSTSAAPPRKEAHGDLKIAVSGAYMVIGTTPYRLGSEMVKIAKFMSDNVGKTLSRAEAELMVAKPDSAIASMRVLLTGSRVDIISRSNGWALVERLAA